ncbi:restriction endonuclease subunit S [Paenibacillus sp. Soil750]|uniref:restriction endonuclease subunit S n=1 Tax=Paenibacillus sp. Soil750 TaxID=1736398 RepID=UPI0006FD1C11|nr:restriction endonuclease subunit S [Paenibacillus sp. Soil750]KRE73914.1 hypothetical protein ASL11_06240 [Paenibacillus sp. Soil750]
MWVEKKLGDICELGDGAHTKLNRVNDGILYLSSKNFQNGNINYENVDYISIEDYNRLFSISNNSVRNLQAGDLIIGIIGTIGNVYVYKKEDKFGISSSVAIIRPNAKEVNSYYLYYVLNSSYFRKMLDIMKGGVAQGYINLPLLRKMPILLPPLPTQQIIADILSVYDNFIDNNNRRIELLEQSAQQIYKEWFVRFRFPGYETASFTKGIPNGWEVKSISELSHITDGTHDTPKPTDEGYYLITGKHIVNDTIDFSTAYYISEKDHIAISKRSGLEKGNILFSNIGTIGSTCIIGENTDFSVKNVIIIKPHDNKGTCFLYCLLKNNTTQEIFKQQASGSSQQFISLGFMRKYKVLIPNLEVLKKFSLLVEPILDEKSLLHTKNKNLAKQRDLLLPRLMNGQLEV